MLYSYILGLYLGDGHIAKYARTKSLTIDMDVKYEDLNNDVINSLHVLMNKKPSTYYRKYNGKLSSVRISIYNCNLSIIFPQDGAGAKHLRKIEIKEWQKDIINYRFLLKGLIMSDGSFCVRKSTGREIYNFTNCSNDISDIARDCLTKYEIKHNHRISIDINNKLTPVNRIEISHRESVEKLKKLIGTKTKIVSCFEV